MRDLTEKLFGTLIQHCAEKPQTTIMELLQALENTRFHLTEVYIAMQGLQRDWTPQK